MASRFVETAVVLGAMVVWSLSIALTFASLTALAYLATISNLSRAILAASFGPVLCAPAAARARALAVGCAATVGIGIGAAMILRDAMPLEYAVVAVGAALALAGVDRLRGHVLGGAPARLGTMLWVGILWFLSFSPRGGLLTVAALVLRHAPLLPRIARAPRLRPLLVAASVFVFAAIGLGAQRPVKGSAESPCRADLDPLDQPGLGVRVRRVLALGDSTTYGLFLPAHGAYPSVAASELRRRGVPTTVLDCAVPGATCTDLFAQMQAAAAFRADVVTVLVGINDANHGQPDLGRFGDCLRGLVEANRSLGRETVVLTYPYGGRGPDVYPMDGINAAIRDLAVQVQVVDVEPVLGWAPWFFQVDRWHPSASGHRLIAGQLRSALLTSLEPAAAARSGRDGALEGRGGVAP